MRIYKALLFASASVFGQPGGSNPSNPARDPWQMPSQVIDSLNFSPSDTVAVIENGYPYFAPRIAPLVKKLYAVNTDSRSFQGKGALPAGVSGVTGTFGDPKLSGLTINTVMLVDFLHLLPERQLYYLRLIAELQPGYRLVIIDRKLPPVYPQRITEAMLKSELALAGFQFTQEFTFLPYQYFLVFKR
jgi:hypothetical protein